MSEFLIAYHYNNPRSIHLGKSLPWCCDYSTEYCSLYHSVKRSSCAFRYSI